MRQAATAAAEEGGKGPAGLSQVKQKAAIEEAVAASVCRLHAAGVLSTGVETGECSSSSSRSRGQRSSTSIPGEAAAAAGEAVAAAAGDHPRPSSSSSRGTSSGSPSCCCLLAPCCWGTFVLGCERIRGSSSRSKGQKSSRNVTSQAGAAAATTCWLHAAGMVCAGL